MPPEPERQDCSPALWQAVRTALASARQGPPLRRLSHDEALSSGEDLSWFRDLDERAGAIHIAAVFRIPERVDAAVLARSLAEVVRRHEVLRTVFRGEDGTWRRVLLPADVALPVVDLESVPSVARERCAERLIESEARQVFSCDQGPLFAFKLLRLEEARHALLATFLHAAFDGWSLAVFSRELSLLYEAFAGGRPSPLPELTLQFADFACWKEEWLEGPGGREQIAFWEEVLGGADPAFPPDRLPPPVALGPAVHRFHRIPRRLAGTLRRLGEGLGATPFITFLAAFEALLHRYSGQDDLCLASVAAGRTRGEVAGLIGRFINALALRTRLAGDPPFREALRRVRDTALEAFAHPDVPFERLLAAFGEVEEYPGWPLQVMFLFQNMPLARLRIGACETVAEESPAAIAEVALMVSLAQGEGGLVGQWTGHRDFFDGRGLALLAEQYEELLEAVAADPDRRLSCLPPAAGDLDAALAAALRRCLL